MSLAEDIKEMSEGRLPFGWMTCSRCGNTHPDDAACEECLDTAQQQRREAEDIEMAEEIERNNAERGVTREERLILLIEECGEVIQAATKCLRFGWERNEPEYGVNSQVLGMEIGDLIGVMDSFDELDWDEIERHRQSKMRRAEAAIAKRTPGVTV